MDDFPEPYEVPDYEQFERNQLDLDRDAEQASEQEHVDECPCCTAPMGGSDHCPVCYCEAHESRDEAHLRERARALQRLLEQMQGAWTRIQCSNENVWGQR